jgi:hypothetical protein
MPAWKIWASVLAIGFTMSLLRALKRRARSRVLRHQPIALQATTVGLGSAQGGALEIWLPAGTVLPAHHRRILRVPSRAEELRVSLHTDEARLLPLADLLVGPLRQDERAVRLVELVIRVDEAGRLGFAAREKSTGHRIKLRIGRHDGESGTLILPTRDAPEDESAPGGADPLADISWHEVSRH